MTIFSLTFFDVNVIIENVNRILIGLGVARLNREVWYKPTRSRHCSSELICIMSLRNGLGKTQRAMNWSQETCLIDITVYTYAR